MVIYMKLERRDKLGLYSTDGCDEMRTVNEQAVKVGYVLALSLIIASVIYFFASNWGGFDKWQKISLSVGLLGLFYGGAFLLSAWMKRRPFLSELFFFIGCISFGVTIALIGQIYNSHADSFMLFVIWAVPSLLLSFFTKYQPFYFLSYLLVHLAVWFFLFPSAGFHTYEEYWYRGFFLGMAAANLLLFIMIEKGIFRANSLAFLAFLSFHVTMLILSTGELFDAFPLSMSFIYFVGLILWFTYYLKNDFHKSYTVLLGLAFAVFIIIKFIAFLIFVGSEFIFLFTIFLPIVIVAAAVVGISKWRKHAKGNENPLMKRIFIGVIALISSVMAASSIAGILFLIADEVPYYVTALLAILGFILPAVLLKKWDPVIRYTVLLTGYFLGAPSVISSDVILSVFFIAVLGFVFWMYESKTIKYGTYLLAMVVLFIVLAEENTRMEIVVVIMLLVNLVLFAASFKMKEELKNSAYINSIFYSFLSFFVLTFLFENSFVTYMIINSLYFVLTTAVLFTALKRNYKTVYWISLLFWFAYILYKYYDLLWSLLHKSLTFMIAGVVLFIIIISIDSISKGKESMISFLRKSWLSLLLVFVLQMAIIGFQVGKSEVLLAEGELVKLELQPVDPRSLLQGDYVILRYTISNLSLKPVPAYNEKIKVGLVKSSKGIYEYSGAFLEREESLEGKHADVWITGRYKGSGNIEYGIENYFVEEGTGLDVERDADYANVKVSENGDAILVSLE
jgi:uncharacterized membrane-anchored protein/uncharacterized membrane protein